jgi:TANFOR domain-containing protein
MPFKSMRYLKSIFLFLSIASQVETAAQQFAVQATTQLIPPYSVYLTDYASPESQKLRVILVQKDLTQPAYQLRLVLSVELNGNVIMRTSRLFRPAPITLDPGIPTVIAGIDLISYLDSRNMDFVGYSRDQYERTRALPEGSYRISFTAYDYQRQDVQVSNEGSSFYWLAKNEPPLINFPTCGTRVPMRNPQQIVFGWLPRGTTSPNSAAETQYEFALYEVRPAGRNPNDVVLTTPPMFRTTTDLTQILFGPAEPLLLEGMSYVWRVQAQDKNGRDAFRNNGYSEVCYFTYSGTDPGFEVGTVQGLQAQAEGERKARIWWQQGTYDNYKIDYKKSGKDFEWFKSDAKGTELKLFDLEPNTEYEARMQAGKEGVFGPYTDIVKFRTTPVRVAQCGQATPPINNTPGRPLPFITPAMFINARGFEMSIIDAQPNGGDGWYRGFGRITVPYLAGASFTVKFDRIYIDVDRNVTNGRIDFVTKGVTAMMEEQLAAQEKRQKEKRDKQNKVIQEDPNNYGEILHYNLFAIEDIIVEPNGNVKIVDADGEVHTTAIGSIRADNPGKTIILEDKNGDQWKIDKDGKASKINQPPPPPDSSPKQVDISKLDGFEKLVKQAIDSIYKIKSAERDTLNKAKEKELKELNKNVDIMREVNSQAAAGETEFDVDIPAVVMNLNLLDSLVEEKKIAVEKMNKDLNKLNGYLGEIKSVSAEVKASEDYAKILAINEKRKRIYAYIENKMKK